MADAVGSNSSNSSSDNANDCRWFCHSCNSEIVPDLSEFKCPICGNGFIEPVEEEISSSGVTSDSSEESNVESLPTVNQQQTVPPTNRPANVTHAESPFRFTFPPPFGFRNAPRMTAPNHPFDGFRGFVDQLLFGLMGGLNNGTATFNIQMGPHTLNGNTGDYVFSAEGLDNIVTMLMNQLEGAGPPPAAEEHVNALPFVIVTQAQVDDKLQCHVCMENFQLGEKVKELPCRHIYHSDCIIPWLQMHGTCPVCRKRIDANPSNPNNHTFRSGDNRT